MQSSVLTTRPHGQPGYWFIVQIEGGGDAGDKTLVFLKVRPDVITPDNMRSSVLVSSLLDSPASSLYHAVHSLYLPALLGGDGGGKGGGLDPKLQSLLGELEAGLGSVVRRKDPTMRGGGGAAASEDNFGGE